MQGRVWPEFRAEIEHLLLEATVQSVTSLGSSESSNKLLRLRWDECELRSAWRPDPRSTSGRRPAGELIAYEIDRMLGLDMLPPTIARAIEGRSGALQFWVNGVRVYEHANELPSTPEWARQVARMWLFDALIEHPPSAGKHDRRF